MTIGVLGGRGLLGSDLVGFWKDKHEVQIIDRDNYDQYKDQHYDLFVNANGNSRRFWANENPAADFELSTASVMKSLIDFSYEKYIYISTPDIYENPTTPSTTHEDEPGEIGKLSPYGFHKRLSEGLVKHYASNYLIIRSAALLGTNLKKGVIHDIFNDQELYVTQDSKIQFITTEAIADIINILLERGINKETINAGGQGAVMLEDIGSLVGKPVRVRSNAEQQLYEMNTTKVRGFYKSLKTSKEYLQSFINSRPVV
jgi:dTDP-4-dehydrorhamnose reductase